MFFNVFIILSLIFFFVLVFFYWWYSFEKINIKNNYLFTNGHTMFFSLLFAFKSYSFLLNPFPIIAKLTHKVKIYLSCLDLLATHFIANRNRLSNFVGLLYILLAYPCLATQGMGKQAKQVKHKPFSITKVRVALLTLQGHVGKQVEDALIHVTTGYSNYKQKLVNKVKHHIAKITIIKIVMYLINISLTFLLINRWFISGHFPLSNLYESLIFLSWSFSTIYSITSFTLRGQAKETLLPILSWSVTPITLLTCGYAFFCVPQELQKAESLVPALQSNWLIMHVSVMILSYASLILGSLFAFSLLLIMQFESLYSNFEEINKTQFKLKPAYPKSALNESEILSYKESHMEGLTYFAPYTFLLAYMQSKQGKQAKHIKDLLALAIKNNPISLLAILTLRVTNLCYARFVSKQGNQRLHSYLLGLRSKISNNHASFASIFDPQQVVNVQQPKSFQATTSKLAYVNVEQEANNKQIHTKNNNFLDNLSYRFIGLGFALLTLGIISGAVWANSAWGSYWSWDPKETWAFITWLTYAIYLHLRISKGWYGKQSAFVALFGFFVVWFCYLGVNLFGKGLHSYAFV